MPHRTPYPRTEAGPNVPASTPTPINDRRVADGPKPNQTGPVRMGPGAQLSHIEAAIGAIERRIGDGGAPAPAGPVGAELVRLYQQRRVAWRELMQAVVEPDDSRTVFMQLPMCKDACE